MEVSWVLWEYVTWHDWQVIWYITNGRLRSRKCAHNWFIVLYNDYSYLSRIRQCDESSAHPYDKNPSQQTKWWFKTCRFTHTSTAIALSGEVNEWEVIIWCEISQLSKFSLISIVFHSFFNNTEVYKIRIFLLTSCDNTNTVNMFVKY